MSDKTYRTALIGCGGRGKEHLPALLADPRVEIVGFADARIEAADAVRDESGVDAPTFSDHLELLRATKPEVVVAALWTPLHLPVFRDCVAAGVRAVLSEKPMAPTWAECQEMARLAEESGCLLTFCHQRRFAAGNQLARKLLADGIFGEIQRMDLMAPPNLLDCGTHTIDQALSFNGEQTAAWALGAVDIAEPLNWFGVASESLAVGHIHFVNGVRASFQFGGPDLDLWGGVRVYGTKGEFEITWDGRMQQGRIYADPSWQPPVVEEENSAHMMGVVRNALNCLETGEEPELSWQKALRTTEILFAIYESVRRRARVTLPLEGVTGNPLHAVLAEQK